MELWIVDIRMLHFLFVCRRSELELELGCSWELCFIALDLLNVACARCYLSNMAHLTVLPSLQAFLAAVKQMQHLLDLHWEKYLDQQSMDHFKTAETLIEGRNVVFTWLGKCFCRSMNDSISRFQTLTYPEELQVICQLHKQCQFAMKSLWNRTKCAVLVGQLFLLHV